MGIIFKFNPPKKLGQSVFYILKYNNFFETLNQMLAGNKGKENFFFGHKFLKSAHPKMNELKFANLKTKI